MILNLAGETEENHTKSWIFYVYDINSN